MQDTSQDSTEAVNSGALVLVRQAEARFEMEKKHMEDKAKMQQESLALNFEIESLKAQMKFLELAGDWKTKIAVLEAKQEAEAERRRMEDEERRKRDEEDRRRRDEEDRRRREEEDRRRKEDDERRRREEEAMRSGLLHQSLHYPNYFDASTILQAPQRITLQSWTGNRRWVLLYRGSSHGWRSADFHRMCDNKGDTVTIVRSTGGWIFGAFSPISWTQSGNYVSTSGSWLFTLTNPHGYAATQFFSNGNGNSTYHNGSYGPTFGGNHDLHIADNCHANSNSYSNLGHSYIVPANIGVAKNTILTGAYNFQAGEIEVFGVY